MRTKVRNLKFILVLALFFCMHCGTENLPPSDPTSYTGILTLPTFRSTKQTLENIWGKRSDGSSANGLTIALEVLEIYHPESPTPEGLKQLTAYFFGDEHGFESFTFVGSPTYNLPLDPAALYLLKTAHLLWVEKNAGLPWSFKDGSGETLEDFLYESALDSWFRNPNWPTPTVPVTYPYRVVSMGDQNYNRAVSFENIYYGWAFGKKFLKEDRRTTIINVMHWIKNNMTITGYPSTGLREGLNHRSIELYAEDGTYLVSLLLRAINLPNVLFTSPENVYPHFFFLYLPIENKMVDVYSLCAYPLIATPWQLLPVEQIADAPSLHMPYNIYHLGPDPFAQRQKTHLDYSFSGVPAMPSALKLAGSSTRFLVPADLVAIHEELPAFVPFFGSSGFLEGFSEVPIKPFEELIKPETDLWN